MTTTGSHLSLISSHPGICFAYPHAACPSCLTPHFSLTSRSRPAGLGRPRPPPPASTPQLPWAFPRTDALLTSQLPGLGSAAVGPRTRCWTDSAFSRLWRPVCCPHSLGPRVGCPAGALLTAALACVLVGLRLWCFPLAALGARPPPCQHPQFPGFLGSEPRLPPLLALPAHCCPRGCLLRPDEPHS